MDSRYSEKMVFELTSLGARYARAPFYNPSTRCIDGDVVLKVRRQAPKFPLVVTARQTDLE